MQGGRCFVACNGLIMKRLESGGRPRRQLTRGYQRGARPGLAGVEQTGDPDGQELAEAGSPIFINEAGPLVFLKLNDTGYLNYCPIVLLVRTAGLPI